jgi:hypothetical protein
MKIIIPLICVCSLIDMCSPFWRYLLHFNIILTITSNVKYGICRYLLALVNDEILTSIYVYIPASFPFSERPLWNFSHVVWVAVTTLYICVLRCLLTVRVLLMGASLSTSMALAFVADGSPSCNQFVFSFLAFVFFSLCYCSRGW